MAIVIGVGALLVFLAFIAWDRRRIAGSRSVRGGRTGKVSSSNLPASALAAVSLVAVVMAVSEFLEPRLPPFTGRWAFVYELAYAAGPFGILIYWVLLAAAMATVAVFVWRSSPH